MGFLRLLLLICLIGVTLYAVTYGPVPNPFYCTPTGSYDVSNFTENTGKYDFSVIPRKCCPGLKPLQEKTTNTSSSDGITLCPIKIGGSTGICSPCGNGICDSKYEDKCNCPSDCH